MKNLRKNLAQSVMEYIIIMCVILIAAVSTGFLGRVKSAFQAYSSSMQGSITP